MSRGSFRARVGAPRPTSAWVLVVVASATLWITRQLDAWAVAVQVAAILVSLWRREAPFAWQKSAAVLNLGMVGISSATVAVALRGEPSTIGLAHFAALTQGLQLLDARPRHTEFLLVTLALFQVILASNLTDSVFFPPLLVAFVLAAVWTLLVHTLRTEALEAGDASGIGRERLPGLAPMTLLASGLSVVLALAMFVALPRLRSNIVRGPGLGTSLAAAGFSDSIQLGEIGRIRRDPRVVMRIETLEGDPPLPGAGYWRGLAFDHFDGRTWSITPPNREIFPGSSELGVAFGRRPDAIDLVQRIVREPVESGVLFAAGELRRLQGTVRRLERDSSGGIYATGQSHERVRYTVSSERREWGDSALRRDRAEADPRQRRRDLQLPVLSPAVIALAQRIAAGHEHDADRVRAIERHLIQNGRYTDEPPNPAGAPPIEAFLLGQLAGHCEYFATSMVLLVRSLGIPARIVNGFAGGRDNPIGGFLEVTRSDAHTWVEVRYARAGWVAYDPTPADLRARPVAAVSLAERARQLASAVELWWFQRVVGFDRSDQVNGLKQMWLAWQVARGEHTPHAAAPSAGAGLDRIPVPLALAALGAACAALAVARGRRRRSAPALPAWYARALRLLARRGHRRAPAVTARAFARQVREREPAAAAAAFDALTEAYLAQRFGGHAAAGEVHLAALRAGFRRAKTRA